MKFPSTLTTPSLSVALAPVTLLDTHPAGPCDPTADAALLGNETSSRHEIRRIAVFRALVLGDMLCTVPALRALRNAYPKAHITLIGLPWATQFIDRYPMLFDDLMIFPGAVGFPEQHETDGGLPAFYEAAKARDFDLAIQLHGSGGVANEIVASLGARLVAGFKQIDEVPRSAGFIPWPDDLPEPARYNALMNHLGIEVKDADLDFPLRDDDIASCDSLGVEAGIEFERLVCIHPGAQLASRRWAPEHFAQVADALAGDGWQIAITGSPAESVLAARVLGAMDASALSLVGRTSLGTLGALVARAQLLVCNDTGLSHIAVGVKAASVVIASGSDTRRWAPLDTSRHRVLADYPACRPCSFAICPYAGHPCANNVKPESVIALAREQLALGSGTAGWPFTLHRRSALDEA